MNLLEMYKQLSNEEKQEFIELLIKEVNKKTASESNLSVSTGFIQGFYLGV